MDAIHARTHARAHCARPSSGGACGSGDSVMVSHCFSQLSLNDRVGREE